MPRHIFEFDCPCCRKRIEVNVRSGKARAVDPKDKIGKDLDGLLHDQKTESERLDALLNEAKSDHATQADRLEDLFKDAKKKADEDGDERPFRPFDLD